MASGQKDKTMNKDKVGTKQDFINNNKGNNMKNPVEVKVNDNENSVLFDTDEITALSRYAMEDTYLCTKYYLQLSMLKPEDGVLLRFDTREHRDAVYSRLVKEIGVDRMTSFSLSKEESNIKQL